GAASEAGRNPVSLAIRLTSVSSPFGLLLSPNPPPRRAGAMVALAAVGLSTLIVYPLKHVAPVGSLSVVYLPAVLVVSIIWGLWLGYATAVVSALAFNFFHLPPVGELTIRDSSNWVALVAFLVVAALASSLAELTRARTRDAEERRREADLAAEMARLLLRGNSLAEALPTAAARLASTLELSSAAIDMDAVDGDERSVAFPLREGTTRLGTLLVGAGTSEENLRRLQERVVPALEALLSAALEAGASSSISASERQELASVIQEETRRLSRLVDNLLDLSRLEAGAAEPRRHPTSIEELIGAALGELACGPDEFALSLDPELPLVNIDAVRMERAFVN